MKVLMINKFLHVAGGAETYVFQLGDWLEKQGHQVEYFGMDHEERCVSNSMDLYVNPIDFHTASLKDKLGYFPHVIRSSEAKKKLISLLKAFKPDVIHINNFNYQLTPTIVEALAAYKKRKKSARVIYTAHDVQLVCPNHMLYNPTKEVLCSKCINGEFFHCSKGRCIHGSFLRSILGSAEAYYWGHKEIYEVFDEIICPSRFMKETLDVNPIFAKKTRVLHNYTKNLNVEEINPLKDTKEPYILFFGRLAVEKGLIPLVEAMKELPEIPLMVAGEGPMKEHLQGLPNVTCLGFLSGMELYEVIKGARFSVCPSVWHENCPFSVIESLKLTTPVLGSRIGGIPELIQEGQTGLLFEAGNVKELKEKLAYLWAHPDFLEEMRENLATLSFMDIDGYGAQLLKIYRGNAK